MVDLFSDAARRNPYPAYTLLRENSPLIQEPRTGLWMVFDFEGVKRVISDHETFTSRMGPDWLIFVDPPRHTKLRALVTKAFTPRSIASLDARIAAISKELLDKVVDRGEMDLAEDFAVPLPMRVIAEMLGIPACDQDRFIRWNDSILRMSYTVASTDGASRAASDFVTTTREMGHYLTGLLETRRRKPTDDLLTRLVQSEVDGQRLTDLEILGFFQILLLAGTETTTNLIDNAILCLMENPGEMKRLGASPPPRFFPLR